jgi:hypothetical protein
MTRPTLPILAVLATVLSACTVQSPGEDDGLTPYAGSASYRGCFTDRWDRALPAYYGVAGSIQSCIDAVAGDGYRYAGLQWYGECWGGHSIGYDQDGESHCNTPCSSGEACGGAWHNSIFEITPDQPQGPVCGDGVCAPGVEDCGLCTGDCPCRSGTHCEARQCVADGGNSGGANLPFGAPCATNEECSTGRCELIHRHGRRCTQSCSTNADCPAGSLQPRIGDAQKCNTRRICRP